MQRNELVASLANRVLIARAAPNSETEAFARHLAEFGKHLVTPDSPATKNLLDLRAWAINSESALE